MKTVSLKASKREVVGSKDAKTLRNEGMVPCVVYGGEAPVHVKIDSRDLDKVLYTADAFNVLIEVEGTTYSTIVKDCQFHPVTDNTQHVDFMIVNDEKAVEVALPVVLKGSPIGVRNGGKLRQPLRKIRVKGIVSQLPEVIEIDVEDLKIGRAIKVADLNMEGVNMVEPASSVIVGVKMARGAVVEDEEEEAAAE